MAEIIVIGGTGQIGSKTVALLRMHGHEVRPASPSTGVNTLTGEGLHEVLEGASVVIDVSKPQTYDPDEVHEFFTTATGNLLRAERELGIRHHVGLTIVGTQRHPDIAYYRAKAAGEQVVREAGVPFTLVHATQFFEFAHGIAANADHDSTVVLPEALVQPSAGIDVAAVLVEAAQAEPAGEIEIAGADRMPLLDFITRALRATGDPRRVVTSADGRYFGGVLAEATLLPQADAHILPTRFDDWLARR